MRRYILLVMAAAACIHAAAGEVFDLNGGWRFYSRGDAVSDNTMVVNLPHTWNADAAGSNREYYRGTGTYLREVAIPAHWTGRRVFMRFNGANSAITLMVNGLMAGEHRGGYTACTFEVTHLVKPGTGNNFWVQVNNSPRTDLLPTAGDANIYGGLFRSVELISTARTAIAPNDFSSPGVYVSSHKAGEDYFEGRVTVKLTSLDDKTAQVTVRITDDRGAEAAQNSDKVKVSPKGLAAISIPFKVSSPRLWDGVADPYLYEVKVTVAVDGAACDSTVVRTGFRDFGYDREKGFFLNGRPYRLRGVTLTQDRQNTGNALERSHIVEDIALVREMGANFICVMGFPPGREFFDECDRAGIMVWSEIPFTGEAFLSDRAFFYTDAFKANGRQQLTEMIRQNFNHPSIIMWGLFRCLSMRGDNPVEYIKELNVLAKKEDPDRYTVCTSNQDGELNFITDLILWQHRFGWSEGLPSDISPWLAYIHRSWSHLNSAVSFGAGGNIYDRTDSLYRPTPSGNLHPERWQTHVHEQTWPLVKNDGHLWAVVADNMFDYGASGRNRGRGAGINNLGLVTFDRKYPKDAFYFYKANWNASDPFVYIAERRWNVRRGTVQTLRVFSNCPEAELLLNGESLGIKGGVNGVFTWENVAMPAGRNTVEVQSGPLRDFAEITIAPNRL